MVSGAESPWVANLTLYISGQWKEHFPKFHLQNFPHTFLWESQILSSNLCITLCNSVDGSEDFVLMPNDHVLISSVSQF